MPRPHSDIPQPLEKFRQWVDLQGMGQAVVLANKCSPAAHPSPPGPMQMHSHAFLGLGGPECWGMGLWRGGDSHLGRAGSQTPAPTTPQGPKGEEA